MRILKKYGVAMIVFFIVPLFALALVGTANAQIRGADCGPTASTPGACDDGLSCVSNPWFGETDPDNIPAGFTADEARVCCSTVWGCVGQEGVGSTIGLGDEDPRVIASNVINVLLGFLGIIAVVLILAGGFMWMTAAGNEDKVGSAKNLMIAGVVGLVIVLAAFGIATFVVDALLGATGATS